MDYIITKIEAFKKNEEFVNIFVNEEYLLTCNKEIVYSHNLKIKKTVDVIELHSIVQEDNYLKCKYAALKLLERSYKTEKELNNRLLEKGFHAVSIERTIDFLKSYKFIDDDNYTEVVVNNKALYQGKNKIKFTLMRRGIDEETIREKLDLVDEEVQKEGALKLAEKKYSSLVKTEKDKYKLYRKIADFLIRKGYSYDITKSVLKIVLTDDIEDNF